MRRGAAAWLVVGEMDVNLAVGLLFEEAAKEEELLLALF